MDVGNPADPASVPSVRETDSDGTRRWVLVVDDDPDHRLLITRAIEGSPVDVEVAQARSVEDARQQLVERAGRDRRPDLVLLDLHLGSQSGLSVLETIRGQVSMGGLPVVVLSSSCDPEDVAEAYASGANGYVHKPTGYEALRDTLDATVGYWVTANQLLDRTSA